MKRAIAIQKPARLSIERSQLLIENEDGKHRAPLEDLGILVLDHSAITISESLLGTMGDLNIVLVACNDKHLPSAILLPYSGHVTMPRILRGQIESSRPVRKRLWQWIVQAKIRSQARFLRETRGTDAGLFAIASSVASADRGNAEAYAASIYFAELFHPAFVRLRRTEIEQRAGQSVDPLDPFAHEDIDDLCTNSPEVNITSEPDHSSKWALANSLLNYGYAVLRAAVARAVVMAGLHPALGIHHRHRENAFALADDLMEPLRVLVDRETFAIMKEEYDHAHELTPALKRRLLTFLTVEVGWNDSKWPLDAALEAYAAGVRACLLGERKTLETPSA